MGLWFKPAPAGGFFGSMHWFAHRGREGQQAPRRLRRWHDASAVRDRAVQRVAARLQLDDEQRALLQVFLDRLQAQREALRGASDWRTDLRSLVQDDTFDRWRAQDLLHARVQALREHGPQVIAALADFYDRLDAQQQHRVQDWLARWGLWQ
jgi:Spy/CpxP family protein refolding chaperone